jgi:curli biogenesis system outer membrane secretion channel CsgG
VIFTPWGRVNVLVGKSMGVGRMFGSLGEAAESYKSAEVKSALRALMEA